MVLSLKTQPIITFFVSASPKDLLQKNVAKGVLNHNQKWFKASAIKKSEHGDRYGLFLLR